MATAEPSISDTIPGVFHARQKRSVRIRDSFIEAGIHALNTTRFNELTVLHLAQVSDNSVGGFYTRFKDKESYFSALRYFTVQALERDFITDFKTRTLNKNQPKEVLESLVDLMVDIFTSRYRGVLRESLLLILEPDDPWAPMRESAINIVSVLQSRLANAFPDRTTETTDVQLRFCFQLIVGVLVNDLVNNYHVFSTDDDSLRGGLKQAVFAYMELSDSL